MLSIPMPFWLGGRERQKIVTPAWVAVKDTSFKHNIPQNLIFQLQLTMKENASRAVYVH